MFFQRLELLEYSSYLLREMHLKNVEISREILDEFLALNLVHRTMRKLAKGGKDEESENSIDSSQKTSNNDLLWYSLNNNPLQGEMVSSLPLTQITNNALFSKPLSKNGNGPEAHRSNFHIWSQYVNFKDNHSLKRFFSPCLHYENMVKPREKRRMRRMDKEKNVREGQIKQIWKQMNVKSEKYIPASMQNSVKKLNLHSEKYIPKNQTVKSD